VFILVREEVPANNSIPNQQCWPVRVTATYTDESPAAVFIHTTGVPHDSFSRVADAAQMEELDIVPGAGRYRSSVLLVICRSQDHATELWEKLKAGVRSLADSLALVAELENSDTEEGDEGLDPLLYDGEPLLYNGSAVSYALEL
jgi:hypothetical protein